MARNKARDQRSQQLEQTQQAIARLEKLAPTVRTKQAREAELSSHLEGFYQEIEKLAKGKPLVEVTDLVLNQTNDIIRDAKSIIQNDTYLDRIKEFVPAGNNPVYPDVLVVIRIIRQSLTRSQNHTEKRRQHLVQLLLEANTIHAALVCAVQYHVGAPNRDQVKQVLDDDVASAWFSGYSDGQLFKFDRLDRYDIEEYLSEGHKIENNDDESFEATSEAEGSGE